MPFSDWTARSATPLLALLYQTALATAALTNVTVDDSASSTKTNTTLITYQPGDAWLTKENCPSCSMYPFADSVEAYNGTWHATTSAGTTSTSASLAFNGVAIYVYCILIPSTPWSSGGASNMAFYLDGEHVSSFDSTTANAPSYGSSYPVYVNTSIPRGDHNFTLVSSGNGNGFHLTILDYIVYSSEESGNSTPTNSAPAASSTPTMFPAGAGANGTSPLPSEDTDGNGIGPSLHTAIIATATVISTLILIVCAVLVYQLRKRRGWRESADERALAALGSGSASSRKRRPRPTPPSASALADVPVPPNAESNCRFQAFFRRLLHKTCRLFEEKPVRVLYVFPKEREPLSTMSPTSTSTSTSRGAPSATFPPPRARPTSSAPSYHASAPSSPTSPLTPGTGPPYAYGSPLDVAPTPMRMLSVLNPDVLSTASHSASPSSRNASPNSTPTSPTYTLAHGGLARSWTMSTGEKSPLTPSSSAAAPFDSSSRERDDLPSSDERRRGSRGGRGRGRGAFGPGEGRGHDVVAGAGIHEDANDGLPPPPYAAATAGLVREPRDGFGEDV
ncbi:hypothetical protein C8Q80DRAFT_430092 [Daedaleopsis nitida]|nr:hypothetical protein C8Q80DRAFT_430092 [Daedaleopsis nitida]